MYLYARKFLFLKWKVVIIVANVLWWKERKMMMYFAMINMIYINEL